MTETLRREILDKRPGGSQRTTSTPASNDEIEFFGDVGAAYDGVTFTCSEMQNLISIYGHGHINPQCITDHGDNISLMRHAKIDGMRMLAAFSRFIADCGEGCDPVREMLRVVSIAGIDIGSDSAWVFDDGDE